MSGTLFQIIKCNACQYLLQFVIHLVYDQFLYCLRCCFIVTVFRHIFSLDSIITFQASITSEIVICSAGLFKKYPPWDPFILLTIPAFLRLANTCSRYCGEILFLSAMPPNATCSFLEFTERSINARRHICSSSKFHNLLSSSLTYQTAGFCPLSYVNIYSLSFLILLSEQRG